MRFATWEPVYEAILGDFGFDRTADEHARDVLAMMTEPFRLQSLPSMADASVAIAGGAPSLRSDLATADRADVLIAASTAGDVLLETGLMPDLIVTDLDKTPATAVHASRAGIPVAIHAHGDNVPALRKWVPEFEPTAILPTTQAEPRDPVRNFGGFTDGDRGAFLADHLGAGTLTFPGWDFDDPAVEPEKRRKLRWAERLLYWLECRRDERFDVLAGRRSAIDTTALPV